MLRRPFRTQGCALVPVPVAEATGYSAFPLRGIEWRQVPAVGVRERVSNYLCRTTRLGLNAPL
jgi:hypothetical protein